MSRDGTYILKYHPGVAMNKDKNYIDLDKKVIREQSPSVEFQDIHYDMLFFEMPKHTLLGTTLEKLHADQILESCDGDDFSDISSRL